MHKYIFLFLCLIGFPSLVQSQVLEDPDLTSLLQPIDKQGVQYWFDEDVNSLQSTNDLSGNYNFDTSKLEAGLHLLHVQIIGTDGMIYGVSSQIFIVMKDLGLPPHVNLEGAQLRYWFDEDINSLQSTNGLSGAYSPEVSSLADGLHVIHYMVVGADGKAYSTCADTFIKMEEMLNDHTGLTSVAAKGVTYWFDDDTANKKTTTDLSGIYSLDVSELEDGLHVLHYHVVGEDNLPYAVTSTMFLKDASQYAVQESARITKYTYWLNHENSMAKTVTLDQPVSSHTLMSLLPLEKMPIRSSMFHFQVNDGVPTIYAKNTFNIRFYDSQGYFADNFIDNERTFIDYGVSQQVTGAELLVSGNTATTAKPAENTIKWYCLRAEPGDSLEFKLDHAASIQIFSPSGEEVYHAAGAESVKWGGCHVEESGMYYAALHDVTSANANTLNLSYNHIDKYAILSFDVHEIGVAESFVPITIQGNGFDKIKNINLTLNGNTITTNQYVVSNKGKVDAFFSLTGNEPLGDYMLSIVFDDSEDGVVSYEARESVHLVEPVWGELKVKVMSNFATFSKTYAVIKVENQGNVAHLYTPLTFAFDKPGSVSQVDFENFFVLHNKEYQEESINPVIWTDDFAGKGIEAESMFLFIPSIKPKETVSLSLSSGLNNDIRMYASVGKSLNREVVEAKKAKASGSQGDQSISEQEKCTIAPSLGKYLVEHTDLSADGFAGDLADLSLSKFEGHLVDVLSDVKEVFQNTIGIARCLVNIQTGLQLRHDLQVMNISDYYDEEDKKALMNSVHLESPGDILKDAGHPFLGTASHIIEWQQLKSKCDQSVLTSDLLRMRRSLDPNDIIGYTAESGSKYIKEGRTDVSYTIEFENDPEFATGSAHTIVVSDVLDPSLYDLSTFAATGIKIGDKLMELDNEKNFSQRTMDLRPAVNVIAQISQTFDEQSGLAKWTIESLDPMTMEPAVDALQGALPVNTDGLGIGEVIFDVSLKESLAHGTEIPNKATIVFDTNEPIETPTWINIIDAVRPTSHVVDVTQTDNGMVEVAVEATDESSGTWQYDVYVQYGAGSSWLKMAENVPIGTKAQVTVYGGIDHGFYSVVTDQAGNREEKESIREVSLYVDAITGDVNGDGSVTAQDASLVLQHVAGKKQLYMGDVSAADVNGDGEVTAQDASLILQYVAGKITW